MNSARKIGVIDRFRALGAGRQPLLSVSVTDSLCSIESTILIQWPLFDREASPHSLLVLGSRKSTWAEWLQYDDSSPEI